MHTSSPETQETSAPNVTQDVARNVTRDVGEAPTLADKMAALRASLASMGSVLVCYSGGVDSAFVLAVAHEVLGARAVGMTAVSPSLAPSEKDEAVALAKQIGARHELVDSSEIEDERYAANAPDRCFHCKSELYRVSEVKQAAWHLAFTVNGTNKDDLGDYRPGLEAAREAGVRSPLLEAGFTKADVRAAAASLGLPVWDKPAAACLSSRIPYGTRVTRERLSQIASLEASLRALGLRQVRVRWHALSSEAALSEATEAPAKLHGAIARIEIARDELLAAFDKREAMAAAGKKAGFTYVTLDLEGYRQGSHNEVLANAGRRSLPLL